MGRLAQRRWVDRIADGAAFSREDNVITEEPLEIRLDGRPLVVTMRTPGNDFELTAGFLVSEGVVCRADQVRSLRYCTGGSERGRNRFNVVDAVLDPGIVVPGASLERNFFATSACGVCGKASLETVHTRATWDIAVDDFPLDSALVLSLPGELRAAQALFDKTGGLHAAGLFSRRGGLMCAREDVGRHNAVDKLVGWAVQEDRLPLRETVLLVSGRASFELVQKATMAGIPALAAVSAPSSLAVELAEESGMTLVGFVRGSSMNVYTGAHRLRLHST